MLSVRFLDVVSGAANSGLMGKPSALHFLWARGLGLSVPSVLGSPQGWKRDMNHHIPCKRKEQRAKVKNVLYHVFQEGTCREHEDAE